MKKMTHKGREVTILDRSNCSALKNCTTHGNTSSSPLVYFEDRSDDNVLLDVGVGDVNCPQVWAGHLELWIRQKIELNSFSIICEHIWPGSGLYESPGSCFSARNWCWGKDRSLQGIAKTWVNSTNFNSVDFKLCLQQKNCFLKTLSTCGPWVGPVHLLICLLLQPTNIGLGQIFATKPSQSTITKHFLLSFKCDHISSEGDEQKLTF